MLTSAPRWFYTLLAPQHHAFLPAARRSTKHILFTVRTMKVPQPQAGSFTISCCFPQLRFDFLSTMLVLYAPCWFCCFQTMYIGSLSTEQPVDWLNTKWVPSTPWLFPQHHVASLGTIYRGSSASCPFSHLPVAFLKTTIVPLSEPPWYPSNCLVLSAFVPSMHCLFFLSNEGSLHACRYTQYRSDSPAWCHTM